MLAKGPLHLLACLKVSFSACKLEGRKVSRAISSDTVLTWRMNILAVGGWRLTGSLDEIERITIVTEKLVEVVPLRITGLGIAAVLNDALYICVVYHLRKKNNFPDMGLMISNHGIAYP